MVTITMVIVALNIPKNILYSGGSIQIYGLSKYQNDDWPVCWNGGPYCWTHPYVICHQGQKTIQNRYDVPLQFEIGW
jgi:hypothetical protein